MIADPVAHFLLAVTVILLLCHVLGAAVQRLGQPPVIGEILGGLLLGPSVLGAASHHGYTWLFDAGVNSALGMAAQLGLVLFVFQIATELSVEPMGGDRRAIGLIVAGGMGVPFAAGMTIAACTGLMAGSGHGKLAYVPFFGLALSITALPVLARVLLDLKLRETRPGTLSLASAAIGDGLAWGVLTVILTLSAGHGRQAWLNGLGMLGLAVVVVFGVRPGVARLVARAESGRGERFLLPALLVGTIGTAALTEITGLHPAVGAFLFGAIMPRRSPSVQRLTQQLQGFVLSVLLPLFFAGIGLSISLRTLGSSPGGWAVCAVVIVTAGAAKFAGATGGARSAGIPLDDALQIGALMNCRGVTELVVATAGYQSHLINDTGLAVLVLMALATTAVTAPLTRVFGAAPVGLPQPSFSRT